MIPKKKICVGCGAETYIFSKGMCRMCAKNSKYYIKPSTQKARDKRRGRRDGYDEFYKRHIENIRKNKIRCAECGCKLKGHSSEVAHILPKGSYPSVALNDKNIIYLCGYLSNSNCHARFDDTSHDIIRSMKIFPKLKVIFMSLKSDISEKVNYKLLNLYSDE